MKKRKLLTCVFLFSLGLVTGCQNIGFINGTSSGTAGSSAVSGSVSGSGDSTETASSSVNHVTKKKLSIAYYPTNVFYNQYETLDLSDLKVNADTYLDGILSASDKSITDYSLTWADGGASVADGDRLTLVGDNQTIVVTKEGYTSASFDISVSAITGFTQSLKVTSATKTSYAVNAALDLSGMVVQLYTSYKDDSNQKHTSSTTVDSKDYTVTIVDPTSTSTVLKTSYSLASYGTYTITISTKGWKSQTLTSSFSVYVYNQTATPKSYTDDTITWNTDSTEMTVNITNPNKTNTDKGYYSPDEVNCDFNIQSYGKKSYENWVYTKSTGKTPLLIVPVKVPGSTLATQTNWDRINKAFFGNSTDLNFESLHSFYYKSSYGQLDFTGCVTDWFDTAANTTDFTTEDSYKNTDSSGSKMATLAQEAADWAKKVYNLDMSLYDSDHDGMIDGMWMVYSHSVDRNDTNTWWAYSSTTQQTGTATNPLVNNFGWASVDFLDDTVYGTGLANSSCDAHVVIHETGHMLGLTDYYSYSYSGYDAMGSVDMMDQNVSDHNPYSKLLYGWVKPYVVYGNATIKIPSCQAQNALIIIPYDDKTYTKGTDGKITFNMFDEYLVLDYYTDLNMNGEDYDCYNATHVSGSGGRLYHVDNRLYPVTGGSLGSYSDPDDALTGTGYFRPISNTEAAETSTTPCESNYGLADSANAWDEIRWISADKRYLGLNTSTKKNGGDANNSSLFKTGSSFSVSSYAAQFVSSTFDTGKTCSYSFTIQSIA